MDHHPSPRHEVNEADRMILWAEMDADNTGQVTKDEFEASYSPGWVRCARRQVRLDGLFMVDLWFIYGGSIVDMWWIYS